MSPTISSSASDSAPVPHGEASGLHNSWKNTLPQLSTTYPSFGAEITISSPPTVEPVLENVLRAISRETKIFQSAEVSTEVSPSPPADSTRACFPAHARVKLSNGFQVPISAIAIGDMVEVGRGEFSPVLMITHADEDIESTFVEIRTNAGFVVIASSTHYLRGMNGVLLEAKNFTVGDTLGVSTSNFDRIVSVERVKHKGLFNPQTASGTLMLRFGRADPVLATTYTTAVRPALAHALMAPLRTLYDVTGATITSLSSIILNTKYVIKVLRNLTLRKMIRPCLGIALWIVLITT